MGSGGIVQLRGEGLEGGRGVGSHQGEQAVEVVG